LLLLAAILLLTLLFLVSVGALELPHFLAQEAQVVLVVVQVLKALTLLVGLALLVKETMAVMVLGQVLLLQGEAEAVEVRALLGLMV
jgi:hypothetical protein